MVEAQTYAQEAARRDAEPLRKDRLVRVSQADSEGQRTFVVTIPEAEWKVLTDDLRETITKTAKWGNPASSGLRHLLVAANALEKLWSS